MSKKFVTERELAFIDHINKELIQHVAVQEIVYYAIDPEVTRIDELYDEAVEKVWRDPVRVNARVRFDNPSTKSTNLGPDSDYALEAYCHTQELIERNVKPKEGDFIEYGQVFFEITSVTKPQQAFGQANAKLMTKLVCVPAREGQFAAGSDFRRFVDRSHPVQPSKPGPRGGT